MTSDIYPSASAWRRAVRVCLVVLACISLSNLVKILTYTTYPDFTSYYYSVQLFVEQKNFYLPSVLTPSGPFLYPPAALFVFMPFSFLPVSLAGKVFFSISLLCLLSSIYFLYRIVHIRPFGITGLILTNLILIFFPVKYTLGMGQINMIILLLMVLTLYWYQRSEIRCASALSLAYTLKLFPLFWLGYLLMMKRFHLFFLTCILCIIAIVVSFVLIGKTQTIYFLFESLPELLSSSSSKYYNQSLSGFLSRLSFPNELYQLVRTISTGGIVFLSYAVIYRNRAKQYYVLSLSLLVTISLLCNGIAWQHHMVWTIVPLLVTFSILRDTKQPHYTYILLGISYLFIGGNLANPTAVPLLLRSHVFYGLVLLMSMQVWLLTAIKQSK